MAHTEIGFEVIQKFLGNIRPYGQPDFEPKLNGRNIVVMITPLPRNKRAKNPHKDEEAGAPEPVLATAQKNHETVSVKPHKEKIPVASAHKPGDFANNPFSGLEVKTQETA
jgi:hypothetical protein